jgi:hypothetical protein
MCFKNNNSKCSKILGKVKRRRNKCKNYLHYITRKEKKIFKYLQQDRNVVQVSKNFANKNPQTFGKITVKMKQKMIKSQCQQALC